MSFICIPMRMNLIKAHGEKGSGPFSFERSATSPPQADHVLVDLFFIHGRLGGCVKAPRQTSTVWAVWTESTRAAVTVAAVAVSTVAETMNAIRVLTNLQTGIDTSTLLSATMPLGSSHSLVMSTGTHTWVCLLTIQTVVGFNWVILRWVRQLAYMEPAGACRD